MLHQPEGKHSNIYHYLSDISLQPQHGLAEERPVERQNPRRWLLSRPSCVHEEGQGDHLTIWDQCGGSQCGHFWPSHLGMAQSWVPLFLRS